MKKYAANFTNNQYAYGWFISLILTVLYDVEIVESGMILTGLAFFTYVFQLGFLVKQSTYVHWRYFRLNNLSGAVLMIASLLRIQHIEGSDELMMVTAAGLFILYLIFFFKKAVYSISNFLKLLCLGAYLGLLLSKYLHLIRYDDWLFNLNHYLLLFLILIIHLERYQEDKNWFKK